MEKQEINNAISEHAMWKLNLKSLILRGKVEKPVEEIKETECEFGKWLYSSITPRQRASAHYKRVKELHLEFHKVAAQVANLASQGKKEEAEKMMDFDGEFTQISNQLMEALIKWKEMV